MPKQHLTDPFIRNLKKSQKRTEYYDQHLVDKGSGTVKKMGVKGLALRVTKAGSKSFVYRYWSNGKSKRYKIGSYPNISLSDARSRARELAIEVNNGIDPLEEKKKRKNSTQGLTFNELASVFSERHLPNLSERTREEYQRIIDVELMGTHKWGSMPVSEITSQHVRKVLNRKAHKDGAFTMANRIRSTISKMFDFGIKHVGLELPKNPVEDTPVFEEGENIRDRYYSEDEIRKLWKFWESKEEPVRSIFMMLLICGQRKTETMEMKWSDIEYDKTFKRIEIDEQGNPTPVNFKADVWTIPAEMTKNSQQHQVPLSPMAKELLDNLKPITGGSDYVFQSNRRSGQPISSIKSTSKMIKDDLITDFRPHDLRRTVGTYIEECGFLKPLVGRVLNQKSIADEHSVTSRYTWYDYMDKKQEALGIWSRRLKGIIEKNESDQ